MEKEEYEHSKQVSICFGSNHNLTPLSIKDMQLQAAPHLLRG